MNEIIWYDSELDLEHCWSKGRYRELEEYAKHNQDNIVSQYSCSNWDTHFKTLKCGYQKMKRFEKTVCSSDMFEAIFGLGKLMGTIQSFERVSYQLKKERMVEKKYDSVVYQIKNLDNIVLSLEEHGVMSHSEICKDVGLKASTLTEIMKKIAFTNLIDYSKSGRYKLYVLSDEGKIYGKKLRESARKQRRNVVGIGEGTSGREQMKLIKQKEKVTNIRTPMSLFAFGNESGYRQAGVSVVVKKIDLNGIKQNNLVRMR